MPNISAPESDLVRITIPIPEDLRDRLHTLLIRKGKYRQTQQVLREIIEQWVVSAETSYAAEQRSEYRSDPQ